MGGMKDEAKRITIPPLFPKVHVNETRRGGMSQPFNGKTMSLYKCSTLPSPTNISLSLPPPPNNAHLKKMVSLHTIGERQSIDQNRSYTSPTSKLEVNMNKKDMNYTPSSRGSSVTNTEPISIKQNECHFKNLSNMNSLQVPLVRHSKTDPQADTDLSLQFCTKSGIKPGGEAVGGSKVPSSNLPFGEILLSESLEDASQNVKSFDEFNNETQKKPKTLPPDVSDCSAVDSLSGMKAASKDIARMIGEKMFWKMRTYMINQQKIFEGQVFELHRLIMVQKMIAKSPKLVLKSKVIGSKRVTLRLSHPLEMAASNQKPVTKEYQELPLLLSISKELVNSVWPQQVPAPLGNQWLVPVMSLSEGLVYKPYTGPSPRPSSAFMVPVYGQDSLDASFRFPVSTQFSHSYFPQTHTETTIHQTNQLQRWSSTSSHMTQAIPFSLKKSQESDDSDVHGSTASSPPEKHKFELLPLFPTEPTHHTDDYKQKEKPLLCATKTIPHNPASESVARIFRSIHEERRDSDHMVS